MKEIPDRDYVIEHLREAVQMLVEQDFYLIRWNLHERTVTHKLGEHLQKLFETWNVDCEYNKNGPDPKLVEYDGPQEILEDHFAYPDVIVHERGDWRNEFYPPHCLVIEARKAANNDPRKIAQDRKKIYAYVAPNGGLKYRFGALIEYGHEIDIFWFNVQIVDEDGETTLEPWIFQIPAH